MAINGAKVGLSEELQHKCRVECPVGLALVHVLENEGEILQKEPCKNLWVAVIVARQKIEDECDGRRAEIAPPLGKSLDSL